MKNPSIASLAAYGFMAIAAWVGHESPAQPAVGAPSTDRLEIRCEDYKQIEFIGGDLLKKKLLPGKQREVLPPCAEIVQTGMSTLPKASDPVVNALNPLLDATKSPLERLQNGFDFYSWLTFVALNVPEEGTTEFGTPGAPTVWEKHFLPLDQVMKLHEDQDNANLEHLPQSCGKLIEGARDADKPSLFVAVDDVAFDQPFKTGPLIDQNGNYSLNTIFVNPTMRNFIVNNHLDTFRGQQIFPGTIDFQAGDNALKVFGAMMIKASWRVLTKADDLGEFHTVKAFEYFPEKGECSIATLGLVGFHVVHKTKNRHQWIWTTFEHVRNVPSVEDLRKPVLPQKSYFFYDVALNADAGERRNVPPEMPWDPVKPSLHKSQIVRAQDISADTQLINAAARQSLDSLPAKQGKSGVWSHYQLISTQWPADFGCSSEGGGTKTNQQADPNCSPAPEFLPNSTLETYIQHDIGSNGGMPQATSSCIACHNNAVAYQKLDFGDQRSLAHTGLLAATERECLSKSPTQACSTASDFTFVFEQVCAPMTDLKTGRPDNAKCKHDH